MVKQVNNANIWPYLLINSDAQMSSESAKNGPEGIAQR